MLNTLCSRCDQKRPCFQMRVVGPRDHPLEGKTFEVCSQKCLNEIVQENVRLYGRFDLTEYSDT